MRLSLPARLRMRAGPNAPWLWLWLVLALVYAWPIAWSAYEQLLEVNLRARVRLIEQHRLWEVGADTRRKPEVWTRVASRLLSDGQLLRRVAEKYGPLANEIELEYRRDLAIARAEVVLTRFALWAAPLAALYALAAIARRPRRQPAAPEKVQPSSASDSRYRRPEITR